MEGLQIGRIVHYCVKPEEAHFTYGHRAAIISSVISQDGMVNLTVFMDWRNDGEKYRENPLLWATSRVYDETGQSGTWHWPEKA